MYTGAMTDEPQDIEFRQRLERRIESYRTLRTELRDRVAELQEELEAVERRLRAAEQLHEVEFGTTPSPDGSTNGLSRLTSLSHLPWHEAIRRVLEQESRPLHVSEIWQRLQTGGFCTEARDPLRTIVAVAIRSQDMERVAPNVYALDGSGRAGKLLT